MLDVSESIVSETKDGSKIWLNGLKIIEKHFKEGYSLK